MSAEVRVWKHLCTVEWHEEGYFQAKCGECDWRGETWWQADEAHYEAVDHRQKFSLAETVVDQKMWKREDVQRLCATIRARDERIVLLEAALRKAMTADAIRTSSWHSEFEALLSIPDSRQGFQERHSTSQKRVSAVSGSLGSGKRNSE